MSLLNITVEGLLPLKRQLELIMMPSGMRRRVLYRVSQKIIRDTRKRVRTQTDVDGAPFAPGHNPETDQHSHKRGRKMLRGLSRIIRVMRNDGMSATIGFPGAAGSIAAKQQYGHEQTMTAAQAIGDLKKGKGSKRMKDPATKRQAKALRDLGYRPRGGRKRPSYKLIIDNMTVGQAGAIIRSMRAKQGKHPKQSWRTKLPPRAFLGATPQQVTDYVNTVFDSILQGINYGSR